MMYLELYLLAKKVSLLEIKWLKFAYECFVQNYCDYSETCLYRPLYVTTFAMYRHDCSVPSNSLYNLIVFNLLVTEPVRYV